ncbi:hypothetical protein ES703_80270 [subsurface metagenome]
MRIIEDEERRKLMAELEALKKDRDKYKEELEKIRAIKAHKASPTLLASSFVNAMETMRTEVKTPEESPVDYRIKNFDVKLKTGVGLDDDDNVILILPKAEELTPDKLSTIKFSISPVPKFKPRIKKERKESGMSDK